MRRTLLSCLALALAIVCTTPALAAAPATPTPDTLATLDGEACATPDVELLLPEAEQKAGCSISLTCPSGEVISCSCPASNQCRRTSSTVTCNCVFGPAYFDSCDG